VSGTRLALALAGAAATYSFALLPLNAHFVRPFAGQELKREIRGDRFTTGQSAVSRDLALYIQKEPQKAGDGVELQDNRFKSEAKGIVSRCVAHVIAHNG
jgi:hypothetical protein